MALNTYSVEFDGTNQAAETKVLTGLTGLTVGSIEFWAKIDSDDGNDNVPFAISRDADATLTELNIDFRMDANDYLQVTLVVDDTEQWGFHTDADSLDAYVGSWLNVAITQDATEPKCYFNGVLENTTFTTSTDKTLWFKSILTDATDKADTLILGSLARNGSNVVPFDGHMDEFRIWNYERTAAELLANYQKEISKSSTGLVSYLKFNNNFKDITGSQTLTGVNSPTFSSDVPFTQGFSEIKDMQGFFLV